MKLHGPAHYAHEKLLHAIYSLATGTGDARSRLWNAYQGFHPLQEKHFPEHLRKDWRWVMDSLTKYDPIYDYKGRLTTGSVEATLKRIRNSTASKIAQKIVYLYFEVDSYLYRR